MRSIHSERLSTWMLHGLHLTLALSIPFMLMLLIGCKKITEDKAEDFGPQASADDIDRALGKAIQSASLADVAVGQQVTYVVTRKIENNESVTTVAGTRVDVINREVVEQDEQGETVRFTLQIQNSQRLNDGSFETTVSEEPLVLRYNNAAGLLGVHGEYSAQALSKDAAALAERKVKSVTFHRLRQSTETVPPPAAVRMRSDCGGLNPCELPLRYVRFDMVQWYEDGGTLKMSIDFAFSSKPPFLPFGPDGSFDQWSGLIVHDCRSLFLPIEGRTVYLRECKNLEDFQK